MSAAGLLVPNLVGYSHNSEGDVLRTVPKVAGRGRVRVAGHLRCSRVPYNPENLPPTRNLYSNYATRLPLK